MPDASGRGGGGSLRFPAADSRGGKDGKDGKGRRRGKRGKLGKRGKARRVFRKKTAEPG